MATSWFHVRDFNRTVPPTFKHIGELESRLSSGFRRWRWKSYRKICPLLQTNICDGNVPHYAHIIGEKWIQVSHKNKNLQLRMFLKYNLKYVEKFLGITWNKNNVFKIELLNCFICHYIF